MKPMSDPLTHGASPGWPALLAGLAVIALAGCTLTRPAPVKETYLVNVDRPAQLTATPLPGVLLVGTIDVAEAFSGKSMVYRFGEHRYEADFYNEFLVSPRDMLTQCVLEWLQKARLYQTVARLAGSRRADADVLRGFVNEMYADVRDPARPQAVLSIQFYLTREQAAGHPVVFTQQLRNEAPMTDASPEAFAAALSQALAAILTELEKQLRAAVPPRA